MSNRPAYEMPDFTLRAYGRLLKRLQAAGYAFRRVRDLAPSSTKVLYLRHDIDFFLSPAVAMAEAEAAVGACATYYVLLTGPYNCLHPDNRRALRRIVSMGHEIGLHYDLETYASRPSAQLRREADLLSQLAGRPVVSITPHNPSQQNRDPVLRVPGFINPYAPHHLRGFKYVSDSCRIWRDDALLQCLGPEGPACVMLLTHPELWMDGSITDNLAYLEKSIKPAVQAALVQYYDCVVYQIWKQRMHAYGRRK